MNIRPVLIIKCGQKLPELERVQGDFEDWIGFGLGSQISTRICHVAQGDSLPDPVKFAGIVVTGSAAMVSENESWAEDTKNWLCDAVALQIPILGICFGHQLLAHALGGVVDYNPNGVEVGTVLVQTTEHARQDKLLSTLPLEFTAQASHKQAVLNLPPGARRLAFTSKDANHAFCYGSNAWGVQFHPEFSSIIVKHYINFYAQDLQTQGENLTSLLNEAKTSDTEKTILSRFAEIIRATATPAPA